MKKTELISMLQKEVDALGDGPLLEYKIVDEGGGRSGNLYSPTRQLANGKRAKMNFKEFRDYALDQRAKGK